MPGISHLTGKYVVWWWGGIRKNPRESLLPLVSIVLRRIDENGHLGNRFVVEVALTYLIFLRIGTVVEEGRCIGYTSDVKSFICLLNQKLGHYNIHGNEILKRDYFKNHYLKYTDQGKFLEFGIANNKKVLVPCLVYFIFCYGFSAELKRILLTYSWSEILTRICGPLDKIKNAKGLVVNLPKRLKDDDAVFIAHTLYDSYTYDTVKNLSAQLEVDYQPNKKTYTALTVKPWFQSPMPASIEGVWLDEDTFLTYSFKAISEPDGELVSVDRQNTNKVKNPSSDLESKRAWSRTAKKIKDLPLTIAHSNYDPHPDEPSIEVMEHKLQILGKRREKEFIFREEAKSSSGIKKDLASTGHGSSGETTRSSEKIGRIEQHQDLEEIHQGILSEMWNAALYLSERNPQIITSVEWLSADCTLSTQSPPKLIMLKGYTREEMPYITSEMKNWTYADTEAQRLRGILVIKLVVANEDIFIAEIERRHKNRATEEMFQGLVFKPSKETTLLNTIVSMINRIRSSCGVMSKVVNVFPIAYSFNHAPSGTESVHCENSIINALKKMNVDKKLLKLLRNDSQKAESQITSKESPNI